MPPPATLPSFGRSYFGRQDVVRVRDIISSFLVSILYRLSPTHNLWTTFLSLISASVLQHVNITPYHRATSIQFRRHYYYNHHQHYIEQSTLYEAASCLANQEIPGLSW